MSIMSSAQLTCGEERLAGKHKALGQTARVGNHKGLRKPIQVHTGWPGKRERR